MRNKNTYTYIVCSTNALYKAQKICGSERALAKLIGINRQRIANWKYGSLIPLKEAISISLATNGRASVYDLRSDFRLQLMLLIKYLLSDLLKIKIAPENIEREIEDVVNYLSNNLTETEVKTFLRQHEILY